MPKHNDGCCRYLEYLFLNHLTDSLEGLFACLLSVRIYIDRLYPSPEQLNRTDAILDTGLAEKGLTL